MKTLFKLLLVLLITAQLANAQKSSTIEMDEIRTVFDKTFSTHQGTTFVMDLEDTSVIFKNSNDGRLRINYTVEFKNYKKKDIEEFINRYKLQAAMKDDKITFTSKIDLTKNHIQYEWEEVFIKSKLAKNSYKKDDEGIKQKSKDSLLKEINESDWSRIRRLKGDFKVKPHVKKWKKSTKLLISKMIIEIPPFINLRVNLKNASVFFEDDLINLTKINSKNSKIKFKEINNDFNDLVVDGGTFSANTIKRGQYKLSNVNVKIGAIDSASMETEFSNIEIGEVVRELFIDDFNSQYIIYNWGTKFENLQIDSQYSKWHFFLPKNGYKIQLIGDNNKVFEKSDVLKEVEIDNYDSQWFYSDSSLYGNIGGSFSKSLIYNYKE